MPVSASVSIQIGHASQIYRRSSVSIRVYQAQPTDEEGCEGPSDADQGVGPSNVEADTSARANSSAEWYLGITSDLQVSPNGRETLALRRDRFQVVLKPFPPASECSEEMA